MHAPDSNDAIGARSRDIAAAFASHPEVLAVALGGSRARRRATADDHSDLDLYVFTTRDIDLDARRVIVRQLGGADSAQLDQPFWGLSDQWIDPATAVHVDINYFDADWMQDVVLRVVEGHEASLGYTTCFWRTVVHAEVLADRTRWLEDLKTRVDVSYPDALRANIVSLNHPVLRGIYTSYASQIAKAASRDDWVSVNHRTAALLASYFDCLFAANRVLHPGEKRLVEIATEECAIVPEAMRDDVEAVLRAVAPPSTGDGTPRDLTARDQARAISRMLDRLDDALLKTGVGLPSS